ncbi:MAG: hypothetical protein ACTTKM_06650 [Prevotella fusca]
MTLHVFNPEHDISLAYDNKYFTAPHAGRQLRHDLEYLPALWAREGDCVLVENMASASHHARRLMRYSEQVRFVDRKEMERLAGQVDKVQPWGWDSAVKFQLEQMGVSAAVLPDDVQLSEIRKLSNRQFSSAVLKGVLERLANPVLLGEASYVDNIVELERVLNDTGKAVIKAPWSSSGRGVRYVDTVLDAALANWGKNVVKSQGGIMVEPYYNKVKDFGMEFFSDADGVHYAGLSVFHTVNGAYVGNSLAGESEKRSVLSAYVSGDLLDEVADVLEQLLSSKLRGVYHGALGVDMMIVASDVGFMLHPVVEINLRHTMGHVALALSARSEFHERMMRIDYDGSHYHLHIVHKDR